MSVFRIETPFGNVYEVEAADEAAAHAGFAAQWPDLQKQEIGPNKPDDQTLSDLRVRQGARQDLQRQDSVTPDAMSLFENSWSAGLKKPTFGVAEGTGEAIKGGSFGQGYEQGTRAYDEVMRQKATQAGGLGTAASVAGSLLSAEPGKGVVNPSAWKLAGGQAALGGIQGAANNAEDPYAAAEGALGGAAIGGLFGYGAGRAMDRYGRLGSNMPLPTPAPTAPGALKTAAATGVKAAGNMLLSRPARWASIMHTATHPISGTAHMIANKLGGTALVKTASKMMQPAVQMGAAKKLQMASDPAYQAIINGPPTREKLALMQMLGLARNEGTGGTP